MAAAVPVALSVASTVMQAGGSLMGARGQAGQYAAEAAQYDHQAQGVDLQALQSSERRRENLNAMVANYLATRAAKGLSADTPTGVAITNELRRQSVRDEGVEALGFLNQSSALRMGANMRRRASKDTMRAGYLEAFGSVVQGAGDLYDMRAGGGSQLGKALAKARAGNNR